MKYRYSFMTAFCWVLTLLIAGGFLLVFADKEDRASTAENRMLQGWPDMSAENLLSGGFGRQFEDFLSDGFFLRDGIVQFTEQAEGIFSRMTEEDRYILNSAERQVALQGETAADEPADLPDLAPEGPAPAPVRMDDAPQETAGAEYGLETGRGSDYLDTADTFYFWLKRNDGGRTAIYSYALENIETVAETLNAWSDALPKGGGLYYALIPFAATGNRWTRNTDVYCGWASNAEYALAARVKDNVHIFNAPAILEGPMARGETLYYRTDHHWAPRGAYCVAMAMIASQGYPVTPYEEYSYKTALTSKSVDGGFRDTLEILFPLLPAESLIVKRKTEVSSIRFMAYDVASYQAYLCSTQFPWRKIITGFHTGRKCLVVCDSFGNVFAPYLMPYYDEVHMVDIRVEYCDMDLLGAYCRELIGYHDIDDVYVLYSTANGLNSSNSLVYLRRYFDGK